MSRLSACPRAPDRPRAVTFSDSLTKVSKNVRREVRPRSRSVYTTSSYISDDLGTPRDINKYDSPSQWSPYVPKPIVVKNYYPDDLNV